MGDKPIIFSAPMVRALLDGRKTQTRRLLNPQPAKWEARVIDIREPVFDEEYQQWGQWETIWNRCSAMWEPEEDIFHPLRLRYAPGDRLYVREHWKVPTAYDDLPPKELGGEEAVQYLADGSIANRWSSRETHFGKHRQGMHMPRWASRLTLLVEDVRVERLQSISEDDARAEGVDKLIWDGEGGWYASDAGTHYAGFAGIWQHLHGAESWDANPWVVAVTFSVERGNIDSLPLSDSLEG